MILTGRRFREGRQLVGMEQADLATVADVDLGLIVRIEAVDGMPMVKKRDEIAMCSVLEAGGVEFVSDSGIAGVRLRNQRHNRIFTQRFIIISLER